MNPNGDPNAPENGGEGAKASTTPTTSPENSVRGRSRLNPNGDPNAPENGGVALPPKSNDVGSKPPVVTTPQQATSSTETKKGGYLELLQALDPYKPPTAEELEKEKRKQKRDSVIAAIGDGVAALSNLYFTTQGAPNMYDGKNTMSEAVKVRYDKLLKDRDNKQKEYFNNYIKMKQLDDAAANNERSWQRQLGLDEEARQRYRESIEHRNERERITDERYNNEQNVRAARYAEEDRRWQATFDEGKRRADRSHNFQVTQHNDNVAARREQARATAARGVRGKQLGFADGNGNQVSIYENVWKGSMQQVFDVMVNEGIERGDLSDSRWKRKVGAMTPSEKEDYVKQNWHKSQSASQLMLALSKIDPATMTSEIDDNGQDDEVEDYAPNGSNSDEEVIDYTPGNK